MSNEQFYFWLGIISILAGCFVCFGLGPTLIIGGVMMLGIAFMWALITTQWTK